MENIERRQFIKKGTAALIVTSTTLCGLSGCAAITKSSSTADINPASFTFKDNILTINLLKEPTLSKVGGAVKIKGANISEDLIIAHVEDHRYEIASLHCSHRGVELKYDHDRNLFKCPSFGSSKFALEGDNISGPAKRPLKTHKATLKDDKLIINL